MRHVMVCDDEPFNVQSMIERLENRGMQVVLKISAASCLRAAREKKFDLFVLDMDLGLGADGIELAKSLWKGPPKCTAPIVGLTGCRPEVRSEALSLGFDCFYKKPLDFSVFERDLAKLPGAEVEKIYSNLYSLIACKHRNQETQEIIEEGLFRLRQLESPEATRRLRQLQSQEAGRIEKLFIEARHLRPGEGYNALEKAKRILSDKNFTSDDTSTTEKSST